MLLFGSDAHDPAVHFYGKGFFIWQYYPRLYSVITPA